MRDITRNINNWMAHEADASDTKDELIQLVYGRLHDIARAHSRQARNDHLFQTTVLLHEAYLRLENASDIHFSSREHFFAYCSNVMRHVVVDLARQKGRLKRGGGAVHLTLDDVSPPREAVAMEDLVAVHEALEVLEAVDPERSRIVELRYFAGMSPVEIASVLGLSESTVHRRWRVARAWLFQYLRSAA